MNGTQKGNDRMQSDSQHNEGGQMTKDTTITDKIVTDGYGKFTLLKAGFEFGKCVNFGFNEFRYSSLKENMIVVVNGKPDLDLNGTYKCRDGIGWCYVETPSGKTEKVFMQYVTECPKGFVYSVKG